MIFKRKIESELMHWKNAANRKPIVLRGARQVGKTFVVNRFAENFNHFIGINLERPKERDLFSGFNTGQELLERILLYKGKKINTKDALLFIDEIQNSAEAVRSIEPKKFPPAWSKSCKKPVLTLQFWVWRKNAPATLPDVWAMRCYTR